MLKVELLLDVPDALAGADAIECVQNALEKFPFQLKATPNYSGPPLFEKPAPASDKSPFTVVYTDGGCDAKRNGAGAWAFLVHPAHGPQFQRVEGIMQTTNNRMELMAVIKALEELEIGPPIRVVSDSKYVIEGATKWHKNWRRNGWLTADGKAVKNRDLWEALVPLVQVHDVHFVHVKGHSGHEFNDHVDELCTIALIDVHALYMQGKTVPLDVNNVYAA
jgi:ribonuclease HI